METKKYNITLALKNKNQEDYWVKFDFYDIGGIEEALVKAKKVIPAEEYEVDSISEISSLETEKLPNFDIMRGDGWKNVAILNAKNMQEALQEAERLTRYKDLRVRAISYFAENLPINFTIISEKIREDEDNNRIIQISLNASTAAEALAKAEEISGLKGLIIHRVSENYKYK